MLNQDFRLADWSNPSVPHAIRQRRTRNKILIGAAIFAGAMALGMTILGPVVGWMVVEIWGN